jgi:tRNA pseudouridine38-40 synthase
MQQRYFIELMFDGSKYHGWQIQDNAMSVQETLNIALSVLFKKSVETTGCGRTDTGVHAKQFYVHFDADLSILKDSRNLDLPEKADVHCANLKHH